MRKLCKGNNNVCSQSDKQKWRTKEKLEEKKMNFILWFFLLS